MLVNNIEPILFRLGMFEVRYYGIIYALGFIIGYLFLSYYVKKGKLKNINMRDLDQLILYLIIGVIAGARLFNFVFYHPSVFWTKPLDILKIWRGGLSFHGGVIGAVIAMIIFSKRYKAGFFNIADALVVPASLALALGRIGNFTNQELYGFVTNVPWCVRFMAVDGAMGVCRHPYQIYASISHIVMFGILFYIYKKQKQEGTTFWSFILIYGIFRVFTDIFRQEIKFYGISMGQLLCAIMIVTATIILLTKRSKISHSRHGEPE